MSRITPVTLDYSDRDFEALKLRLQGLIRTVFPDWTDFNTANFGNILLEMFCFVGDVLHFYQDRQAAESFTPTLTQRTSMIRLGQLINFSLTGATAATGSVTVALKGSASAEDLPIPRGTRCTSNNSVDPIPFQTTEDATLPAGSTSVVVDVEQSERRYESFDSAEEPNQEVILSHTPFLENSMDTVDRDGIDLVYGMTAVDGDYHRVDSFLGCSSTDKVFTTLIDHLDRCHVRFGNGMTGAIPQGEMNFAYKIGGGTQGNIESGKITVLTDTLSFPSGPAPVTLTNTAATSGGVDRMGLEEAKAQAPASLRTLTRTITKDDFETVARSVRGVARALMATANEYAGIPENTGRLYVVARGIKLASGRIAPGTPSATLLAQVATAINSGKPPTITFTWAPYTAVTKTVDVLARVHLAKGAIASVVGSAIRESLKDFFAAQLSDGTDNTSIDFGANLLDVQGEIVGEIAWSDVLNAVRDVSGVRKIDESAQGLLLNLRHESVTLTPVEFPVLGTVTLIDMDTNLTIS